MKQHVTPVRKYTRSDKEYDTLLLKPTFGILFNLWFYCISFDDQARLQLHCERLYM